MLSPPNFFKIFFPCLLLFASVVTATAAYNSALSPDAVAILSFKSKADLDSRLIYTLKERFDYCQWQGVKCVQGRVVRLVLQGFGLRGAFASNTLTRLDQLRVLSLKNNSLSGSIPDLALLVNLKSLFLDHNSFSGTFPVSLLYLHRLLILDLSRNNFSGSIPVGIIGLDRLSSLRLDGNYFNGSIPPLNQSSLEIFNVSANNLTGPIPVTPTLSHFSVSSFALNPNLCGEVINKPCLSASPFFNSSSPTTSFTPPASPPFLQVTQSQGMGSPSSSSPRKHKRFAGLILGFVVGTLIIVAVILSLVTLFNKYRNHHTISKSRVDSESEVADVNVSGGAVVVSEVRSHELEMKDKKLKNVDMQRLHKSGNLVFCAGESPSYTLEQLMKASAELLGRGTLGTTYKAVMNNQLVVTVKRLDAGKTSITSSEAYERHMEMVGQLRHPNLVPMRAFFQANEERLIIYDYQPNGSLFNLIHGSRSTRAKPLHWTSCLKIAEDVAHGLAYIHQSSNLIHGNIKSSNVLLGSDFEACTTDYSLSILRDPSSINTTSSTTSDPDTESYKAPEARKSGRLLTPKSDVYAFGILLLELLTGRRPSQHPFIKPADLRDWVRAMRDDDNKRLEMLVDVASICSLASPEHRPQMWQVLKMIQDIKDRSMREEEGEEDDNDEHQLGTVSSSSG